MDDKDPQSVLESSLKTYRTLTDNISHDGELSEDHINEAFEDNENVLPIKNGWSAESKIQNGRLSNGIETNATELRQTTEDTVVESMQEIENHLNNKKNANGNGVHIYPIIEHSVEVQKKKKHKEHKKSKKKSDDQEDDENVDQNKIPPVNFFSLFRYSSRLDKLLMCIGCLIALCAGAALPIIIVLFGNIVDQFIENHKALNDTVAYDEAMMADIAEERTNKFVGDTARLCMYVAIVGCSIFCFNYIMVSFFSMAASNQAFKIRCLFMKSVLRQDIGWFDTNQTGDFASRITADLNRIQDGIGEKVGICISFLSQTVLAIIFALSYGWKLTLVILCIMPILSISMAIIAKIQAAVSGDELSSYGAAGAVAEEVLSSVRTVVAFGGEKKEIERYDKLLQVAKEKGVKRGLLTSIGAALIWFCIYCAYALAFWYGVKLIVEGRDQEYPEYKPSTMVIIFFNVMMGAMGIGQTAPYFEAFNLARGAAAKIYKIIERVPIIDSSSDQGRIPSSLHGDISLNNVHFSYPARPDVPILKGLSLKIKAGETVALVGPSGCGKSTVIQLIQRYYDTEEGKVFIDEHDVKDLNVGWLRDNIGVVGQEPVLFSTTIAENICYGKVGATQEEVEKAAKAANVHDFISALPLKYNTLVGERGTQLSGGQKQRIAIARALIRNPKILLLDEATSALDTESESIVQAALDQARQGRTTIIVAHRLSTIRTADKIVVISAGNVKEVGTHDELMMQKGIYYDLVTTQVGVEDDEDEIEDDDVFDDEPIMLQRQLSILSSASCHSDDTINSRALGRTMSSASAVRPSVKKKTDDLEPSKRQLLKASLPEWPLITVGGICALIMGLFTPMYGIVFGDILAILSRDSDEILTEISFYSLIFVGMAVGSGITTFLQTFMFSIAGERLTSRLRKMAFTTMISQDMSWFDLPENGVGSLCSRLSADASSVQGATGSRISTVLQASSTLVAAIIIGLWFNWKLGLVVLAYIPLVLVATYFESRIIRGNMLSEKSGTEDATKVAVEAIESVRTVASLHQEETFYIRFRSALTAPLKKSRTNSHVRGVTYGFAQSIPAFAYATAMYYGAILVSNNELHYGNLFKVLESVILGTAMVGQAVAFAPDYQKAKAGAVRIFKLLDLKTKINAFSEDGKVLENVEGEIQFKYVRFNYPSRPKVKILRGLNLKIEPGKTIALVGSSGCGKSTCIQLMERFYDAQKGEVTLDDVNIKNIRVSSLRSQFGLVSQEPVLFSYSLSENIAYGDNSRVVPMDEIISAARQANIHNFISNLPQGYSTPIGDKGAQLSGGQKQRIAIARALVRNPKILLLDEATSALDAESEKIVQEALDKASSGRTCIIIAHRLTTIQNADMIVVIHRGRVVEKGTHQELLAKRGHYYNLHSVQSGSK